MNSQILYFQRTTPQMEKIFNSYMDEAVNLYNEQFQCEAVEAWDRQVGYCGHYDMFLVGHILTKWKEMIRDN